jgi:hypothetical protein
MVFMILFGVAAGMPVPLRSAIILYINLATGPAFALAYSAEPPDLDIMQRAPVDPKEPLITARMWWIVIWHGVLAGFFSMVAFYVGLMWHVGGFFLVEWESTADHLKPDCLELQSDGSYNTMPGSDPDCPSRGIRQARAMAFATLILSEIVRGFSARSLTEWFGVRFLKNWPLIYVAIATTFASLSLIFIPGLNAICGFYPPVTQGWYVSVGMLPFILAGDELFKALLRNIDSNSQRHRRVENGLGTLLAELRTMRKHIEDLELQLGGKAARKLRVVREDISGYDADDMIVVASGPVPTSRLDGEMAEVAARMRVNTMARTRAGTSDFAGADERTPEYMGTFANPAAAGLDAMGVNTDAVGDDAEARGRITRRASSRMSASGLLPGGALASGAVAVPMPTIGERAGEGTGMADLLAATSLERERSGRSGRSRPSSRTGDELLPPTLGSGAGGGGGGGGTPTSGGSARRPSGTGDGSFWDMK